MKEIIYFPLLSNHFPDDHLNLGVCRLMFLPRKLFYKYSHNNNAGMMRMQFIFHENRYGSLWYGGPADYKNKTVLNSQKYRPHMTSVSGFPTVVMW